MCLARMYVVGRRRTAITELGFHSELHVCVSLLMIYKSVFSQELGLFSSQSSRQSVYRTEYSPALIIA